MKNLILILAIALGHFTIAHADIQDEGYFRIVSGNDVLKYHELNQQDDTTDPVQAYKVILPAGLFLYSVDVKAELAVCGVSSYDYKTKTLTIEGYEIEYDAGHCDIILTIYEKATKKEHKVTYRLESVGT